MFIVHPKNSQVKMPVSLAIFVAVLKIVFPGWTLQASPRPRHSSLRQKFTPHTFEAALNLSLQFGYNSVRWEAVNA